MVETILTREMIKAGRRFVRELDERGMSPEAAFWLYNIESHLWRLTIADNKLDIEGPRPGYQRMRQVLEEIPEPEDEDDYQMTLDDITLVGANTPMVKGLRKMFKTGMKKSGERLTNGYVDGARIDDAYVYHVR